MQTKHVTIVMYHYVRPIAASKWPRIKGLELAHFQGQLDYIGHHYTPITMDHYLAAVAGETDLPDCPILLSFDDGYVDHYRYASAELSTRGWSGAFYPPACALIDREILDVNQIHYILAAVEDPSVLAEVIDQTILDATEEFDLATPAQLRQAAANTSRWDTPEVSYIKRMLQDRLPRPLREMLIDKLFNSHVSSDPSSFADELYMTVDHAREMIDLGMHIGSHGEQHQRLSFLNIEEQRREIERSLRIFPEFGQSSEGFTFCYPYGDYDRTTMKILAELGCSAALTTRVGVVDIANHEPLELARINTNDLPVVETAAPINLSASLQV